jgi:hypothetical protein
MHATGFAAPGGAAGEAAPRPYMPWWRVTGATCACDGGGSLPRPVGVRRCLTRRPGGPGNDTVAGVRMEITAGVGASRAPGAEAPG